MSTQQQALILDTILALRRKLKRKAYDSDSDSSIDQPTNRGNKLKKRARYVHQGRLLSAAGPTAYREMAEHAGYQRAIIHRNPPLIDEDGYDIDSDDDEEQIQEAVASAMEENPYSSIHLEQILAPLTSVTDLPSHPTFSRPFTSRALNELIEQGRNLMQKENKALWKAKPLLTKLVGDNTWAPCGLMTAPDDRDALLFSDTVSFFNRPASRVPTGPSAPGVNGSRQNTSTESAGAPAAGSTQQDKEPGSGAAAANEGTLSDGHTNANGDRNTGGGSGTAESAGRDGQVNGKTDHETGGKDGPAAADASSGKPDAAAGVADVEMAEAPAAGREGPTLPSGLPPPNVQAAPSPVLPAEPVDELFIHPLFKLPPAARQDRDLGLPEQEAEEVRRLLLLYVQKQEEICRNTKRLYEGLLKADRLRRTVWQWAKAEAHCGPNRDMSDGEDWYDKEEWGLTEDLKKGEDEVEEETAQTQKKTRNRK
ncbi:RXT2-like protein [Thermothelomyces heterothallicus CBS 202.75]|uniref:RXT2-like protein n=1 Tax=Thermothelomyces heterothallicus CBS 202.75 TaxID=1149848 RepID=UPI0037430BEF